MAVWTRQEDELIIADYFQMLKAELKGLPYNKTAHRRHLLTLLKNRNDSAIEFKHRNISAVLTKYGMPYIIGYMPLANYQDLLEDEVLLVLNQQKGIERVFNDFALKKIEEKPKSVAFSKWKEKAPSPSIVKEFKQRIFNPIKRNYLEIEQNNQSIGMIGEQLVFDYEIWKLRKAELPKLANEVRWVSKHDGDGAGYDILSRDIKGREMYIEVKTTKLGKQSPIFFSNTEFEFSKKESDQYFLYRVFNVKDDPKLFIKNGSFAKICSFYEATNYKGAF